MSLKKRYLRVTNLLFLILIAVQFLPDRTSKPAESFNVVWFAIGLEVLVLILSALIKKPEALSLFLDIVGFVFAFLILWTLASAKFSWLKESLFPPPGRVLSQFITDFPAIMINIKSSLSIIVRGYLLAGVLAIPLGLFLGWSARIGSAATYISKFLSAIPPIVYIPYGIALLPTFRSVSVMVIFLATFWPVLASTMSGVLNVEQRIIDSAKVLNVNPFSMLFSVILPAALPQIFIGCNQGLTVSFILLTSAEMIGARDGLGYYVKNYSDFGDYTRTILGIIVIGIVVVAISFLFNKLQHYLLRWKK
jgi:NitT/TauT family transport system permease protein